MIWFALPAVPQPGIDATTGVAKPPLVAFLELQAILFLQLVLVVREALQNANLYFHFFLQANYQQHLQHCYACYSSAQISIFRPKIKHNNLMHPGISNGMPSSPDQLYCIQAHLWASHIQRL